VPRALAGAPLEPLAPLRPAWGRGFAWRSLGRSLPAFAIRVRLGLGLAASGGAASPSVLAPSSLQENNLFL